MVRALEVMLAFLFLLIHILLVCLGGVVLGTAAEDEGLVVDTPLGSIRGEVRNASYDRKFYAFTGIPYTKPPIGKLRYKDPVPAEPWMGVRENFLPPMCPQIDMKKMFEGEGIALSGEEDCLYLHVYTPKIDGNFPVMVFIHGGGYIYGFPDALGGSALPLLNKDIVLVTIQYRLGVLGFLSTEDDVLPGNLGLKDQTEALKWVQTNIKSFGGDPHKVTIFGESAGSGSVHQQILSPEAEGLFHRAIMQSGSALCPWAMRNDHKKTAGQVGHILSCSGISEDGQVVDSGALFKCLQKAPLDALILNCTQTQVAWNSMPLQHVPRVDGNFIPDHPARLLQQGRYNKVDIISGITAHEGASSIQGLESGEGERLAQNLDQLSPIAAGTDQEENSVYLAHRTFSHYLGKGYYNITNMDDNDIVKMFGDVAMAVPIDITAQLHSRDHIYSRPVYMYQLDHNPEITLQSFMSNTSTDEWVAHGEDLRFLFKGVALSPELTRVDDILLSDIMVQLWTNFAAHGNPTPDMSLGFKWTPATPSNLNQLSLTPAPIMKPNPREESHAFLTDLPTTTNKLLFPEKFAPKNSNGGGYCSA